MKKFLLVILIFLVGCAHQPNSGIYNRDRDQDAACFDKFGGRPGYCDFGGR